MIIITGAAGFIGSCMAAELNAWGENQLVLVDDFGRTDKSVNYAGKKYFQLVERDRFFEWVKGKESSIRFFLHLGARTDTTESDESVFERLNFRYSLQVWELCSRNRIPLIYASSAATYGDGTIGFDDDPEKLMQLMPLNPYGRSKQQFDLHVLKSAEFPPFWAGLKFFNVYGPNESHKGRMASVIYHAYQQISKTGKLLLFRSHRPDYDDGEQKRDFIYVKDVTGMVLRMMEQNIAPGIYNLGTGQARSFNSLAAAVFESMRIPPKIEYFDTPVDIRGAYQYFTEARMGRLSTATGVKVFHSLEDGIEDYVVKFLSKAATF